MSNSKADWPLLLRMLAAALLGFAFVAAIGELYVTACPETSTKSPLCTPIQQNPPWTLISAVAAAPSLLLTWYWRTKQKNENLRIERATQRVAQAQQQVAQAQLRAVQEQQSTARFVQAISMLEKKNDEATVLGGIYALERLAGDSSVHVVAVIEILSAYVRKEQPIPTDPDEDTGPATGVFFSLPTQTTVTVLGRLPTKDRGGVRIDLSRTDLRMLVFRGDFEHTNFDESILRGAQFDGSINHASFHHSDVASANFSRLINPQGIEGTGVHWSRAVLPARLAAQGCLGELLLVDVPARRLAPSTRATIVTFRFDPRGLTPFACASGPQRVKPTCVAVPPPSALVPMPPPRLLGPFRWASAHSALVW